MRILLLCLGNAETMDSWSGVTRSLVRTLRDAGHTVLPADVELYGLRRMAVAGLSFARPRRRWWVRYNLGAWGFRARSQLAAAHLRAHAEAADVILQIGATFQLPETRGLPLALYCDSNIAMSRRGASSGFSEAAVLTPAEVDEIAAREAAVFRQAALIFTMSDLVKRSFEADFGVPSERLVTVHCAPNEQIIPDNLAAGAREPVILWVGRDFGRKGGDVMLAAFAEVRRQLPAARLVMVGPTAPAEVPPGVEFPGYLSRDTADGRAAMDRAYRSAAVFCLPTRFEPFGTAFVEAMTYGVPCVGPEAWAVPEIIAPDETGLLVPPEDPAALAAALLTLLRDPERARRMGDAARRRALARFTWPAAVERMQAALAPLVAPREARPRIPA